VATAEGRNSTTYGDPTTVGPSVTTTVSGGALVIITARISSSNTGQCFMSFDATSTSGPNVASSDARSLLSSDQHALPSQMSATYLVTGLSAESYTFTAKYRANANGIGCSWSNRNIIVIPQ